jgi:Right handed beta helix region
VREVPIGTDERPVYYLSPNGADTNAGTREKPWLTIPTAISKLLPGDTLVLLDGRYRPTTTGLLDIRCGVNAVDGTAAQPITVRADHERMPFLKSDGTSPPLHVQSCSFWTIEGLHVESLDLDSDAVVSDTSFRDGAHTGTVVVLEGNCDHVVLRRLLAAYPNRYKHSHVIRIGDGATHVLVEECEAYNFHHNGIEIWRATSVTLRRNYVHARSEDIPAWPSDYPGEGDVGILIEEAKSSLVENNIAAGVHQGIFVAGRFDGLPTNPNPPGPVDTGDNRLLGNVTLASAEGFVLQSRCLGQPACAQAYTVTRSELTNDVAIGGKTGLYSTGAIDTRVTRFGAIGSAAGVTLERTLDNIALSPTSSVSTSLALGFVAHGFASTDEVDWSFDHCAAFGSPGAAFSPDDAHVTSPVRLDPALGECTVYVPTASPLRGAGPGGSNIGPSVIDRYEDGELTPAPLWDPKTGAFPCGAVVAGLNDDPATSCTGAHQILHVGAAKCPFP